jgi:antitoxin (DNA-binding transcriptional repressor) of toxin-antitoxin stability system
MSEVSATEAARQFSRLLDSVEHEGRRYTIRRHGKVVAQLEPVTAGRGVDVKDVLRRQSPDGRWRADLASVRDVLEVDQRG